MSTVDASAPPTTASEQLVALLPPPREQEREDQRPEEIELLLDRERPDVPQQRRAARPRRSTTPCGRSGTSSRRRRSPASVWPRSSATVSGRKSRRVERDHAHHQEERREEPPGAAQVEPPEPDVVVLAPVAEEQARDQVAADHEEHVDAEEAARHPLHVAVIEQHGDDRERPAGRRARGCTRPAGGAAGTTRSGCSGSGHHTMVARPTLGATADCTGRYQALRPTTRSEPCPARSARPRRPARDSAAGQERSGGGDGSASTAKSALITGASKGIGLGMATAFAREGAAVMLSSRKQEALDEAAARDRGRSCRAPALETFAANAGEPDQAEACVAATIERLGGIDVLVNNAAHQPGHGPHHRRRPRRLGQDVPGERPRGAGLDPARVAGDHGGSTAGA